MIKQVAILVVFVAFASVFLLAGCSRSANSGTLEIGKDKGQSKSSETDLVSVVSEQATAKRPPQSNKRIHRVEVGRQPDAAQTIVDNFPGRLPDTTAHALALNVVGGRLSVSNETPYKIHLEHTNRGDALVVTFLGPTLANTNVINYISKVVLDPTNGQVRCIVLPPR